MTNILELCQRLMRRHCQIADAAADLAALVAEQGQEINLLSALVETPPDEAPRNALLAKAPFFLKYEMAPAMREWIEELVASLRAGNGVVAETAEPFVSTLDQLGGFGFDRGPEPVLPEMAVHAPSTIPPSIETNEIGAIVHSAEFAPDYEPLGVELPAAKPKRAKAEYTAREWALSTHFLNYMKKAPFNAWTAAEQTAKRDAFVAAMPAGLKMNRWGERFSKFCGVA